MTYEEQIKEDLISWQKKMIRKPSLIDNLSKKIQVKMNTYIPEKVHRVITGTIKQMVRGVLFGAGYTVPKLSTLTALKDMDEAVQKRILFYRNTAAAEGGLTGAGGFLLGLAEFPVLLSIKLKLLFDVASLYGYSVKDYKERLYILHIFQLAFSSSKHRKNIYRLMENWDATKEALPEDINEFDWRNFQQEYRDYIDLAKMAQLIPGIGAVVGIVVNYRLIKKLGITAMNAYRMRWLERNATSSMQPI